MEIREIIHEPEIQALQARYLEQGLPFQENLQNALNQTITKLTDHIQNPQVKDVVSQVVAILEAELIKCIAAKAGSWLSKLFTITIPNLFKRKK